MGFRGFGVLLGAGLGLLSGSLDLLIWSLTGYPDFMVREGWELMVIAASVVCGYLTGLVYGAILRRVIRVELLRASRAVVALGTVSVAACFYVLGDYTSLKTLNCFAWFATRILVFFVPLAIAGFLRLRASRAGQGPGGSL